MLDEALKLNPSHPALMKAASRLLSIKEQPACEIKHVDQSHPQHEMSAVELHEVGRRECEKGRSSDARAMFSRAVQKDPRMPHAYVSWARMESRLGDIHRAIEVRAERVCHNTPKDPGTERS